MGFSLPEKKTLKKNQLFPEAANARGASLIIVIWVLALLTFAATEYAFTMRVESIATANYKDSVKAHYLAFAGINLALKEIMGAHDFVYLDSDGKLVFAKKTGNEIKALKSARKFELGEGTIIYTIHDERGKLNLNTASREMISMLLRRTNVEAYERDVIADSIVDWRDKNHEFHLNGAEDDYYQSLSCPYDAKDGAFNTVEELLLVKGVTPEVFYGTDNVPPGFSNAKDSDNSTGAHYSGLFQFLTVMGDGKLNINTANEEVLEAVYGTGKSIEIMLKRATEGYFDKPAFGGIISSNAFLIDSTGEVRGLKTEIQALVRLFGDNNYEIMYWREGI